MSLETFYTVIGVVVVIGILLLTAYYLATRYEQKEREKNQLLYEACLPANALSDDDVRQICNHNGPVTVLYDDSIYPYTVKLAVDRHTYSLLAMLLRLDKMGKIDRVFNGKGDFTRNGKQILADLLGLSLKFEPAGTQATSIEFSDKVYRPNKPGNLLCPGDFADM